MKTTFTSLLILLVTCGSISAQRNVFGDRWQINNFGLTTGINMDYHHDMSLQWMADHTANSEVIQLPEEGFDRKDIYGEVAGVTFAGQVGLNRANDTFEGHDSSRELVLSAQVITGREAFISYAYDIPRTNQRMEETIGFCLMDNEFNLGAEYRMVKRKGPLDLHLGAGSFMGSTFNPDMLILRYRGRRFNGEFEPVSYAADAAFYTSDDYQSSTEIHQGNTSQFARAYVSAGVGFVIAKHFEFNMQMRGGIGVEYTRKSRTTSRLSNFGFLMGVRWHIPKFRN